MPKRSSVKSESLYFFGFQSRWITILFSFREQWSKSNRVNLRVITLILQISKFCKLKILFHIRGVKSVAKALLSARKVWGSNPGSFKSYSVVNGSPPLRRFFGPASLRRKPRRWAPPFVARFGVIPRKE